LAAIFNNKKMLVQGMHGTGKSTHIEQVAARLNWPCVRVNFDSQISRSDLVGKDVITLRNGKQITEFKEGVIPYSVKQPTILILDEYDAIRTDVSFVIQRLLEQDGKFTLLEENQVIEPHEHFRLFATSNTLGMGDDYGIYHGTNLINQGQMDRWNIVYSLGYLDEKKEKEILLRKVESLNSKAKEGVAESMILMANLTRQSFKNGDLSNLMTLRTLINWAQNYEIFDDIKESFKLTFFNKILEDERVVLNEFFQRVFAQELEVAS
jgi:cobaltochelatase CobS